MGHTKGKAADGWSEAEAIQNGASYRDVFGILHGLRTTSIDPAVAANPVTAEEREAEAALAVAIEKRDAALAALQEGERSDPGKPAFDYNTNKGFMMFAKKKAAPTALADLRADWKAADEAEVRARVKLSHVQERRAEAIRRWNEAQIVDTPLAKAIADAQRNGLELTPEAAKALAS